MWAVKSFENLFKEALNIAHFSADEARQLYCFPLLTEVVDQLIPQKPFQCDCALWFTSVIWFHPGFYFLVVS